MTTTCGFIGLGQMGLPMARNLARQARLVVWDRNEARAQALLEAGATPARDAQAFAGLDLVFLCLPDGEIVADVLFGSFGLADTLPRGCVVVDTSTIEYRRALDLHERLATRGIEFVDAPVSGMQTRAEAGSLTMMCGGALGTIERLLPLLECMASLILPMGKPGSGQLAKLINQLLFDINAAALAEVLPLAVKLGLDAESTARIVNSGTGRSYASECFIPTILAGDFGKGYPMKAAYKDLVSGAEISARNGIPMPVLAAATAVYQNALLAGHGGKDKGGMICLLENALGVQFRSGQMGNSHA